MKNKWLIRGILSMVLCTFTLGVAGCRNKTDKEPISDENAISTVKTL